MGATQATALGNQARQCLFSRAYTALLLRQVPGRLHRECRQTDRLSPYDKVAIVSFLNAAMKVRASQHTIYN